MNKRQKDDETQESDTETTVDYTEAKIGFKNDGDLRLIYDYFDITGRNGETLQDEVAGFRFRTRVDLSLIHISEPRD